MSAPVNDFYGIPSGGTVYAGVFAPVPPPVAGFIGAPTSGTIPLAVVFTDQSTGSISTWLWDFGDSITSTSQNPTHVYNNPGVYNVSLTVTGPGGSNTYTRTSYVNASAVSGPTSATLTGATTVNANVQLTHRVTLNQAATQTYTITWIRSNGGTGVATSQITTGQTYVDATTTWNTAGTGRTVDFTISPSLTKSGAPLTVDVVNIPPFTVVETGNTYNTLGAALNAATSGQTVVGLPGTYVEYAIGIGAKTITLRSSIPGSKIIIDASTISSTGGGSIFYVSGGSLDMTDVRLTGNKYEWSYNPGITTTTSGGPITLTRVEIDECSNGILHGDGDTTTTWTLINCHLHDNGDWNGLTHNIYIGKSPSVILRGTWVNNTKIRTDYIAQYGAGNEWRESWGHLVKSRSKVLLIEACRLTMEVYSNTGGANRCIDFPCGGDLTVKGTLIEYRTNQNNGLGQAISWGVEGANRISGTTFDSREFKVKLYQNTIVARSAAGNSLTNSNAIWIGVGMVADGWSNQAPTPAPTEYAITDNILVGWKDNIARVIEGGAASLSTTYAVNTTTNTVGALSLLTDATAYNYQPVTPVVGSQNWSAYSYEHPQNTVARVDNYRGAVYKSWGTGVSTGTYNSGTFTLTPARDGAGLVNAVSWELVPTDTIIEVANTRLDSLDSVVKTQVPGWYDVGGEDWNGVTDDWNGMAVDDRPGMEKAWLVCSGGHAGSSNDGIYKFDVRKMQWEVQRYPSNPANWSASYISAIPSGSATGYPPAATYYASNPTSGIYYDEIYDPAFPSDPLKSPRTPTSRHTYGASVFTPDFGAQGTLFMGVRRHWQYDIATDTWALPKSMMGVSDPGTYDAGENMQGWWDHVRGRYYLNSIRGSGGPDFRSYWYDPVSQTFGNTGYFPTSSYPASYTGLHKYGDKVYTVLYHTNTPPYAEVHRPKNLVISDIPSGTNSTISLTLGSSFAGKTFPEDNDDSPQFCTYVASRNKILAHTKTHQDGITWCWIDPTTGVVELATFSGLPMTTYVVENKIRWLPGINAIIWIHRANSNIRMIKLG